MEKENRDARFKSVTFTEREENCCAVSVVDKLNADLIVSCYLSFDEFQEGRWLLRRKKGAKKAPDEGSQSSSNFRKILNFFIEYSVSAFVFVMIGLNFLPLIYYYLTTGKNLDVVFRVFYGFWFGILPFAIILSISSYSQTAGRDFCGGKFSFNVKFYSNFLCVEQSDGIKAIVAYTSDSAKMLEYEKIFLVMTSAKNIYVVPKRCLNERKIEKIREYAKKFEDRYIVETKS